MPDHTRRTADLSLLHPLVRSKVEAIQSRLNAEGIPLRVFESFRTPHRQSDLYAQGRTKPGKIVTKAPPWRSYHQFGCAVDFVFFENGEWHWGKNSQHQTWYERMHAIARENGLEPLSWETPHVQLMGTTTEDLAAGRYPSGGDATWADNLNEYIDLWQGTPASPPKAPVSEAARPPFGESGGGTVAGTETSDISSSPSGGSGGNIPPPDAFNLRSRIFAGNAALEAVLDGHRVLRASGGTVAGIELVQDAFNQLAARGVPRYGIETGSFRGYFGQRTEGVVEVFQSDMRLFVDGVIGQETMKALDAAMVRLEAGGESAPPSFTSSTPASGGYAPPTLSAALLDGVDFKTADAAAGASLLEAYRQADLTKYEGDPSNCKALLKFPGGTVYFDAKMAICADGSPRAIEIDPPYGLTRTAFKYPVTGGDYFNAEDVPYIVLPGKNDEGRFDFAGDFGIKKLDCGVVIYRGQVTPAFYGEVGPTFRLGEASISVHEKVPAPVPWTSSAKAKVRNSSVSGDVLYLIFPGTAVSGSGKSADEWLKETLEKAMTHFRKFVETHGAQQ